MMLCSYFGQTCIFNETIKKSICYEIKLSLGKIRINDTIKQTHSCNSACLSEEYRLGTTYLFNHLTSVNNINFFMFLKEYKIN